MKTYSEKLKDPRWQRKRLEILQRDEFKCSCCDDADSMLSVHHRYYVSGRMPWEYPNWSLQTLCKECHKDKHEPAGGDFAHEEWEDMIGFIGYNKDGGLGDLSWDITVEIAQILQKIESVELRERLFEMRHSL